ncbi:MAG TPA: ElyC/SanA/YdcF family protein [Candidatus Paceibacterota bacterium]|nr:ElyC/SanA/YdcF family protein [Candidatus Paceibacterota bacterium]
MNEVSQMKEGTPRHLIIQGVYTVFFFLVLTLLISFLTTFVARNHIHHDYRAMPNRQIAVVFGTSPFASSGEPNSYFMLRMNTAAGLFHAGKIKQIIITGDNRAANYNEPRAMRKALEDRGVPSDVIHEDYAGRDTLDSVLRARDIFGAMEPLYITQRFHADRAIAMALWHGIPAEAYIVPETGGVFIRTKLYTREYLARIKMAIELLSGAVPAIAGKFDPVRLHVKTDLAASSTVGTSSVKLR